ncbi:MAG: hypothetical protein MI922_16215, partial [Bacteroidales bacterium]|nr:hypothetical protein [Bacteroidales bacterium]
MNKVYTTLIALLLSLQVFSQWTHETMEWDNQTREYEFYVPPHYNGTQKLAVIFILHQVNGVSEWVFKNGFAEIAENKNVILISPQALPANPPIPFLKFKSCWNSGAGALHHRVNEHVQDLEFLMAILDKCIAEYNVDESKIYSTGFSMGGFMSNRLAIETNGRIKKIASASGTIGHFTKFKPTTPVSVLHFHGMSDIVVFYQNNIFGTDAVKMVDQWVKHNKCNSTPLKMVYPDRGDAQTYERFDYINGTEGAQVSFIKVKKGGHHWYHGPNNDINYNEIVWDFFFGDENYVPGTAPLGKTIWMQSMTNNKYVTSDQKGTHPLIANKKAVKYWQKFDIVDAGNEYVAILAHSNGRFVTVEDASGKQPSSLLSRSTGVAKQEKFKWVRISDDSFVLKSVATSKFVKLNTSSRKKYLEATALTKEDAEVFRFGFINKSAEV